MAFTYGFYNSKNHDRPYNAEQMSAIFDGVIKDGVFSTIGNIFAVAPGEGLQVTVDTGKAWFNHTWNVNDSIMPLPLATADVQYSRIDAVVLEINRSDESRTNTIRIVQGSPASAPQKPELTRSGDLFQYPLAYITVDANAVSIDPLKIEKVVGKDPTPFVTGILESVDISSIYSQWNAQFNLWFDNVKAQLEGDVVTNLQRQIELRLKISDKATEEEALAGVDDTKYLTPATGKKLSEQVEGSDKNAKYKKSTIFFLDRPSKIKFKFPNINIDTSRSSSEYIPKNWSDWKNKLYYGGSTNLYIHGGPRLIQSEKYVVIIDAVTAKYNGSDTRLGLAAIFFNNDGSFNDVLPILASNFATTSLDVSAGAISLMLVEGPTPMVQVNVIASSSTAKPSAIIDVDNKKVYARSMGFSYAGVISGTGFGFSTSKYFIEGAGLASFRGSDVTVFTTYEKTKDEIQDSTLTWNTSRYVSSISLGSDKKFAGSIGDKVFLSYVSDSSSAHTVFTIIEYDFSSSSSPSGLTKFSYEYQGINTMFYFLACDDRYLYFWLTAPRDKILRVDTVDWTSNAAEQTTGYTNFYDAGRSVNDTSLFHQDYIGGIGTKQYFMTQTFTAVNWFDTETLEYGGFPLLFNDWPQTTTSYQKTYGYVMYKIRDREMVKGTGCLLWASMIIDTINHYAFSPYVATKTNKLTYEMWAPFCDGVLYDRRIAGSSNVSYEVGGDTMFLGSPSKKYLGMLSRKMTDTSNDKTTIEYTLEEALPIELLVAEREDS